MSSAPLLYLWLLDIIHSYCESSSMWCFFWPPLTTLCTDFFRPLLFKWFFSLCCLLGLIWMWKCLITSLNHNIIAFSSADFTWEKQTACHYLLSLRTQRSVSKILYFCCGRKLFVLPSAQRQPRNRSSNITNQDNCRIFAAVFRTLSFKTNRADQLKSRLSSTDDTACICIK